MATLHADSSKMPPIVTHVDTCPSTKLDGSLSLLREADDDSVLWLESTATAALAK